MKRRVNKRFLIIITLSVVGVMVLAMVSRPVFFRKRPEHYVQMAVRQMEQEKYEEAARSYGMAFALTKPRDPDLLVKQGDAYRALTAQDPDSFGRDARAYSMALEVDPKYKPALKAMLRAYQDQLEFYPNRQELYQRVRQLAMRLAALDPADNKTKAKIHSSVLQAWLIGVATDRKQIDEAMDELSKIMDEDPANSEVPFVLAQSKLQLAGEATRNNLAKEREQLRAEAGAIFDRAVAAQPKNADIHIRAAMVYARLSQTGRQSGDQKEYAEKFKQELARAQELAKTQDMNTPEAIAKFVELQSTAATLLTQMGDSGSAQKLLEGLMKEYPNEASLRLQFARLTRGTTAGRDKAIEILSQPLDISKMKGLRAVVARDYVTQMLVEATGLRMDQWTVESDEAKRTDLMKQIEAGVDKLSNQLGEVPATLTLRGRLAQLQGRNVDAIQTLEKANNQLVQLGRPRDYELMFALSRSYYAAKQTGQAKKLLGEILYALDNFVPARLILVQILLQENALEEAGRELNRLEQLAPDEPEVARLRVTCLILGNKVEDARRLYSKLPERNLRERTNKYRIASSMGNHQEAIRLIEAMRKDSPQDLGLVRALAGEYVSGGQRELAIKLVKDLLSDKPTDPTLQRMLVQIQGPTTNVSQEAMASLVKREIDAISDPLEREVRYYNFYRDQRNVEEANKHLNAAEKIKPDDVRILDLRFQNFTLQRNWEKANEYLDKLQKLNADKADGLLYRFKLAMARGETREGLALATDLTKRLPEFAVSYLSLGQAQQASGQYEEAISRYRQALEKQNENADALRGIIECYYALGRPSDAQSYLKQARDTLPNSYSFWDMAVNHDLRYGDGNFAVAAMEDMVKQVPEDKATWNRLGSAYLRVATVQTGKNETAAAQQALKKLQQTVEAAQAKWPEDAAFYALRADAAGLTRNLEEGEAALKQFAALPAWKDKVEPQLMLGEYYARFNKIDLAQESLSAALKAAKSGSPQEQEIRQRLATLLAQAGRLEAALKVIDQAGDAVAFQRQRAQMLFTAGKLAEAEQSVKAALEKSPDAPELLNLLALIYVQSRRYEQAAPLVDSLLKRNPQDASALAERGVIRMQQGVPDLQGAQEDLEKARELNPSNGDVRYWLALIYHQKHDYDRAIQEVAAAVKANPLNRALRIKMVDLCGSAQPPRWIDAERVLSEARSMPELANDPIWPQLEADMWLGRKQLVKALGAIRDSVKLAPNSPEVARKYLSVLLDAGNYKELLEATDQMLSKGAADWWVYTSRAVARRRLEQKDAALAEFEKALSTPEAQKTEDIAASIVQTMAVELGVDDALARIGKRTDTDNRWRLLAAYLYNNKHDSANAMKMLELVLADIEKLTPPQKESVYRTGGVVYMTARPAQTEKAISMMKQLLQLRPDDMATLNNLACLLVDGVTPARPSEAKQYSQKAYDMMVKSGRTLPMISDTQGWVLVNCGDLEQGIYLLRQLVARSPFLDAHYHLAEAYLRKSDPREAMNQLKAASDLIDAAKKERRMDPQMSELSGKIEAATARAKQMMQDRAGLP